MARKVVAQEVCPFCEAQPCTCDTQNRKYKPRKKRKEASDERPSTDQ